MNKLPIKMESSKRRKPPAEYENFSKEELVNRIIELEKTIQTRENSKQNQEHQSAAEVVKRRIDFAKYNKRHIAIKLLYLGWNYDGYVIQDNTTNTIEDYLFHALIKGCLIENREGSNYHRCGRTDQGVSSFSQVISITVRSRLNEESTDECELPYCKILNGILPSDIRAVAWSPVKADFSARFSCKQRTYKYWFPKGCLNIELMNEGAQKLVGIHDFRNLCKMDVANGVTNFKREIFRAGVFLFSKNSFLSVSGHDMYYLIITAKGFLWHQIRCIVSILLLIGENKENPSIVQKLLDVENYPRKPQYALSSPVPLNLYSCEYDDVNWKIDEPAMEKVIKPLQLHWTSETIKSCMLENMLQDCYTLSSDSYISDIDSSLLQDLNSRNYKSLLSRPMAQSLEDRVSYYVKKGKLKGICNDKSETK